MFKPIPATKRHPHRLSAIAAVAMAICGGGLGLAGLPDTAEARIQCRGAYQLSGGNLIATPYCADLNLTRVARSYGIRVSFDAIRYSPSEKERVCRAIGHDNRVSDACVGYRPEDSGRRWIR
jgi:hypothetical protein